MMLFSGAMNLIRLKEGNEGSCKTKGNRCPDVKKYSFSTGKGQMMEREKLESLPEEVVEEILSRLPVKSIALFRCVCKLWHHLSRSKRFISLHVKNYRTSQLLVGNCRNLELRCTMYFLRPPPPPNPSGCYYYDNIDDGASSVKNEYPHLLSGSCNGIVCLYSNYAGEILLWNPATNESKRIQTTQFHLLQQFTVGFGFDPETNDYKILRMVYIQSKIHPPIAQMELYSLRRGSWKKIECHEFMVTDNHNPVDVLCSLPFTDNRIVCAVVWPLNGGANKWEILCFDMSTEKYVIIPVSPSLDAELGGYTFFMHRDRYFKLLPFKETIALGIVHRNENDGSSYCDFWVLSDFNSAIESRSITWTKSFSINLDQEDQTVPVGCWGSSQIIFLERVSGRLISIEHNANSITEHPRVLHRRVGHGVTTTIYKESLVQINNMMK